jgi:multiple sugar transport system substrate-binding protein
MDDYLSGSLDTATYEEGIYGLPWIGQPYVVYYNKTYFEENGIAEPSLDWTWDDFQETAKAATTEDMYGFATTGNPPTAVFIWGEGGEIVENDGTVRLTEPDSVKGIELASEISTSENTMPYQEAMSMGVEQAFVNGEIAMMVGGANDDVERKVEDAGGEFEVGMAIMPAGSKEHVTFNWTASTLISEQTEQPDVAFEALVDITNAIFEWKVPSPMASKVEKIGEINPYKAYAVDTIIKSAEISRGFNNLPEQNELGAQQWEMLDLPVLSNDNGQGNVNPQEIADQTAEAFENIIK